ncbi:hypothetical protein CA54_00590 [Symmachiella macrocystis]|uniref:TadE-like protein n=1 Tax=Symmachiella macrocystis TaxID=2527985 RepID=A0A5C6BL95_9PLAN|nr:hypothetical protein [Symmachiella macrocystis]TWU11254.1 hypothetical protein CA54_00590 [Symmachiella macrocystis]
MQKAKSKHSRCKSAGQALLEFPFVAFVLTLQLGAMLILGFMFIPAKVLQVSGLYQQAADHKEEATDLRSAFYLPVTRDMIAQQKMVRFSCRSDGQTQNSARHLLLIALAQKMHPRNGRCP